ncbi:protein TESPA1 isoform X1 [Eublepharis macularius]|uniref:Protein TESPA1 isoform X1 n=1 Tax=Eublepharis macularius TaxID=481883 RepID=A0AA97KM09_EUBMA|nr:protein TESPA1 isoform X1 [Eublepharis macularius]
MESSSSRLSPSSWKRQQAWANQYCTRHSTAIEEETSNSCQETPELQPAFLEEAFLQGNSSSTIENWLEQCNSSGDPFMDSLSAQGASGPCSNRTSFEDDLSLGAEAILLLDKDTDISRPLKGASWSDLHLNLDHSLTSSTFSVSTNKTNSSISEVLERCEVDAETVLSNLGFIQEETPAASWIPARFFAIPSQAQGIDFQLFLKAQVQRLEMEDPYLMLASRFKQVQTLAITANAFFCLYSYVSKTPVQKISPALLFSAFPDIPDSWNTPSKQETESPLQRLKKAISRMCLYTLPSSKKQPPMSRLEQIAWEVIDLARKNRLYCDVENRKEEPPMVHSGGPSLQARRSASSMSTATSTTSSCFYFKASSQSGQKTEFPQALSLCRLSHCTRETSIGETGHIGYQEQYCYGRHSPKKASSPEESSDESEGN